MSFNKYLINLLLLFIGSQTSTSQVENISLQDSLTKLPYDKLQKAYYANEDNRIKSKSYAEAYLGKAKKEKDSFRMSIGYHFLGYHYYNELSFKYSDSIIFISKNKGYKIYPLSAYLLKADIYFTNKEFKKSFDNYIEAKKYVSKDDAETNYYINHQIGGIKAKLLLNSEALKIFRESWRFVNDNKYNNSNESEYLQALTDLAIQYVRNDKIDSATVLNKLGIKMALKESDSLRYNLLVLNEGISLFFRDEFTKSRDSIIKTVTYFKKINNHECLSFSNYYLGKIEQEFNNEDLSIEYFKNNDSIYQITGDIHPLLVDGHETLVDYYKRTDNKEKTLSYIEKLLDINKLIDSNYRHLSTKIISEYDTPKLISEKDKIINSIKKGRNRFQNYFIVFFSISILLFFLWIYNYRKQKKYKTRFKNIIEKTSKENNSKKLDKKLPLADPSKKKSIDISDRVLEMILSGLEKFEKDLDYTKQGITLGGLAKQINTNSRYLSLVINHFFEKSFVLYVNNLRVNYAIEKLKTDKLFRKYTIKAIANEVGFNSSESFASAFYKETGLKPSYFIKKIETN
ncbi:helix-turn-helix domain-containing protein [uncultured Aquimarina sp.]|uniref:helix-turn-helix domain-containing protein n=1 Tax=uncultured Aquimarina sp. TaxID=575652 RepID=UPI002632C5A9|nr:helix-turn-helix domain-containing protein [uncultured Aquimarina sp.]